MEYLEEGEFSEVRIAPVLCTLNLPTCAAFAAIQCRELEHDLYPPESTYQHDHDARSDEHLLSLRSAPKPLQWPAKELRHLIASLPSANRLKAKIALYRSLIHPTSDLFNSEQELGGLQPLSF